MCMYCSSPLEIRYFHMQMTQLKPLLVTPVEYCAHKNAHMGFELK